MFVECLFSYSTRYNFILSRNASPLLAAPYPSGGFSVMRNENSVSSSSGPWSGLDSTGAVCLTDKEREALTWCAHGKTSWEIALIEGCSESTVNFHFNNIRQKMNVHTRREALLKALQLNLIKLS